MFPCLILAYLGLTYIKQLQIKQEQIVVQGLKSTLGTIAEKIEAEIHSDLHNTLDSINVIASASDAAMPWRLHNFLSENLLLNDLFVIDRRGTIIYPRTFPNRKELLTIQSVMSPAAGQWLTRGEEAEAEGNFDKAIIYYTNGTEDCATTQERLAFMIRIARCCNKSGETDRAIKTYRRVINDDANRFLGEEVPYQFVASLQLANILAKTGNRPEAFLVLSSLYGKMLIGFNHFDQNQFNYYLGRIKSEMHLYLPDPGEDASSLLDSLRHTEEINLEEPKRNAFIRMNVLPSVQFLSRSGAKSGNQLHYFRIENIPDTTIYVAFRSFGIPGETRSIIGTVLNYSQILTLAKEIMTRLGKEEGLNIDLLSESNNAEQNVTGYIAEETLYLLSGSADDMRLAISGAENLSIKEFTAKSVRLYYILIFTIILMIALGVIFILQDISREQELTRMKADFISNITHEIKTPITTIRNLAENVNEGWVTSSEKQHDYFRIIEGESEKLGHLIEKTLDFSRIESISKRYNLETCSLNEVIEKTLKRFRILTLGQEIDLSVNIEENLPAVNIDAVAIEQALLNLLDNAVKYSPGNKTVRLTAIAEGRHIKVSIADNGIGIAPKDRSRIFDKFYRSETGEAMNITGSGIGLTLVKDIIEAHGGDITVESRRNKGSTFIIRIPII